MYKKPSIKERLKYKFDNTLSRGTIALIFWLAIFSILIILIGALLFTFARVELEGEKLSFFEATWQTLMRTVDAGTVAGDSGWTFRFIALLVTIGGIFIVSTLISILTSGLENKLDDLRKGQSKVLEKNHTLILGWSEKIFPIIEEIIKANESQKKPKIVIMSEKDKIEMEDEIRSRLLNTKGTKIICRTGNPLELSDLPIGSPNEARSIIILAPEDRDADTYVIKSVLALTNNPDRKKEKFHIIAEIGNEDNLEAAKLVGGDEVSYVLTSDLVARAIVQSCRQSGLSTVYTELLSFEGSEIYFKYESYAVNKRFFDISKIYNTSTVIGIKDKEGNVTLNPQKDRLFQEGEELIFIADDDSTIVLDTIQNLEINNENIREKAISKNPQEKTLILGWNEKGSKIIEKLSNYLYEGSITTILSEQDKTKEDIEKLKEKDLNQEIKIIKGDTTNRKTLEDLNITSFDHIIILSYDHLEFRKAEAKTLISLLHLRNIGEQRNKHLRIVSEILSEKNKRLAEVSKADDYIISEKLTSLVVTQLSENKSIKKVLDDLFDAEGSEIYLEKAADYIKINIDLDFYTVLESAFRKNQTAIGYRINAEKNNPNKNYGVVLNPKKSDKINLKEEDKIIVIASK
uniref:Potassium transporter TrkA n=1 Tax=candidate division CPR3 bacterium TaxID=2268181 RepID=A0A7C4R355_UNCC3